MSELIQAVILLAHFHAFSAFVLGCGSLDRAKQAKSDGEDGQAAETRPNEKSKQRKVKKGKGEMTTLTHFLFRSLYG